MAQATRNARNARNARNNHGSHLGGQQTHAQHEATKNINATAGMTGVSAAHLSERAMLVNLKIGFWEGRKMDKKVTAKVAEQSGAEMDAGAWWTRLVSRKTLGKMVTAINEGRHLHYRMTLPWNDQGGRVLPAAAFMDFTAQMRAIGQKFQEGADEFLAEYPKLAAEAADRLGDLYRSEWFPSVRELREKYSWQVLVTPLPDARDFRVDLGDEATKEIQASIEAQNKELMAGAMRDLWERLYAMVERLVEKLADAKGIFRDSMFEHLTSLCELMPKLNISGDKNLEEMRKQVMAKLTSVEPEVLRTDKVKRADSAKAAKEILAKMDAFLGKKK